MSMSLSYSTIWQQLSSPYRSPGAIPFVAGDGGTIRTDVNNLRYIDETAPVRTGSDLVGQLRIRNSLQVSYVDGSSFPEAVSYTMNVVSGIVPVYEDQTFVTVESDKCFASSIVLVAPMYFDPGIAKWWVIPSDGFFIIQFDAAADTSLLKFKFLIVNTLPTEV